MTLDTSTILYTFAREQIKNFPNDLRSIYNKDE